MSLTKILVVALATCLAIMAVMALKSTRQASQLRATTTLLDNAKSSIKELNESLSKQVGVAKATDVAVANAVAKTAEVTTKAKELSNKVVEINKGVVDGKIDSTAADAAYFDSMWTAYCEAKPSDVRCATRRTDSGLRSR